MDDGVVVAVPGPGHHCVFFLSLHFFFPLFFIPNTIIIVTIVVTSADTRQRLFVHVTARSYNLLHFFPFRVYVLCRFLFIYFFNMPRRWQRDTGDGNRGGGERKKQTVRTNRGRATVLNAENSLRMDMRRGGDLKSEHLTKNDTEPGSRLVVFRNDVDFERKKKKRPPNFQRIHTTTKWATITMKFELTNTRHKTSGNFEWLQNSLDKNGNINVRWNAFGS